MRLLTMKIFTIPSIKPDKIFVAIWRKIGTNNLKMNRKIIQSVNKYENSSK